MKPQLWGYYLARGLHRHIFRQDAILHKTNHTVRRILVKFSRHIPDFPIYLDGTKPRTLHTNNLEAKFSTQLKLLAGDHHGRNGKTPTSHAGLVNVLKTNLPNNPVRITKQSLWGQDQLT